MTQLKSSGKIPLRAKDGTVRAWALVDRADFAWLMQWRWCLSNGYAQRLEKGRKGRCNIKMHRQILGLISGDGLEGDHKNRNPLDNRRSNLRIVTRCENKQNLGLYANNTSGYRGVNWHPASRKWHARAKLNGERDTSLGYHNTPEEADAVVKAFRAEHMPFSEDAEELTYV